MLRGQASLKALLGRPLASGPRKRTKDDATGDDPAPPQAIASRSSSAPDRLTAPQQNAADSLPAQRTAADRSAKQQRQKKQKLPDARSAPPVRTTSAPAFRVAQTHTAGGSCPICSSDLPANLLAINLHIGALQTVCWLSCCAMYGHVAGTPQSLVVLQMTACIGHPPESCHRPETTRQGGNGVGALAANISKMRPRHSLSLPSRKSRPQQVAAFCIRQEAVSDPRAHCRAHRPGSRTPFTRTWWGDSSSARSSSARTVTWSA
jgi:hypothetical protein